MKVLGTNVPFPLNSDACKWGLTCPVTKGSNQELKITMPLSPLYPKIKFGVKVAVVDSNGKDLMCVQFNGQIV